MILSNTCSVDNAVSLLFVMHKEKKIKILLPNGKNLLVTWIQKLNAKVVAKDYVENTELP